MTWLLLAFASAALLGCYDTLKKVALKDNAVIPVLFFRGDSRAVLQHTVLVVDIPAADYHERCDEHAGR